MANPSFGYRKYRASQHATVISTVIVLLYMLLQYKVSMAMKVAFSVDGANLLLLTGAAVSPMLWYMGANVWTHAVQIKAGAPKPEKEEKKEEEDQ